MMKEMPDGDSVSVTFCFQNNFPKVIKYMFHMQQWPVVLENNKYRFLSVHRKDMHSDRHTMPPRLRAQGNSVPKTVHK